MSTKTAFIRARTEPILKDKVDAILEQIGLNPTEAIRLFYSQIVLCNGLPFKVEIPNVKTRKAINGSIVGETQETFSTVDELFDDFDD